MQHGELYLEPGFLEILEAKDKWGFLDPADNWGNHRPLLYLGLALTDGKVVEFGSGKSSTPYLREYCKRYNRTFYTYDNNIEYCRLMGSQYITDWDTADVYAPCGLAFIDHAPGEHRHVMARVMKNMADVLVLHDTEVGGAGNYMWDKIWHLFKHKLHINRTGGGAGASLVSNQVDLSVYAGLTFGNHKLEPHG